MEPSFDVLPLAPKLRTVLVELGYVRPTPIQEASLPALLAGRDLIGRSKTGSGKTLAFALPILQGLRLAERDLQALVLCPTRELCAQVARAMRTLGRTLEGVRVLEIVGGQMARTQREALERGVHVAIGTPGRVLDHLTSGALETRHVRRLVLDEADRMLDMGFLDDVQRIVEALPRSRQTMLFSATFPEAIEDMARTVTRKALRVAVEDEAQIPLEIEEFRLVAEPEEKLRALGWLLQRFPHESALIFCNFKTTVLELARALARAGASVDRLDGDLDQFHRDQALARFRNGSVRWLVATDVAGRGLDVEGLDLVVNYELPQQPEIYVHRIGRTGRAGQQGLAISLVTHAQDARLASFENWTGRTIRTLDAPSFSKGHRELKDLARPAPMETLLISGGRKDKIRPGDILGALTGEGSDVSGADVGKIEVHDRIAYVAVARTSVRQALAVLQRGRIKGKRFRITLVGARPRLDSRHTE